MKLANAAALTAAILVGVLAATPADARGGRGRVGVGVYIGGPVWGPAWYPRPYYYYPYAYGYPYPAYTYPYGYPYPAPASPPVYIERDEAPAPQSQSQSQNWYYCPGAKAYYPYVRECPGGWQQVPAQPSSR